MGAGRCHTPSSFYNFVPLGQVHATALHLSLSLPEMALTGAVVGSLVFRFSIRTRRLAAGLTRLPGRHS